MLKSPDSKTKGSVILSLDFRRWSTNTVEYICWGVTPKEALIAFISLAELTRQFGVGDKIFLRKDFVNSSHLSDFYR